MSKDKVIFKKSIDWIVDRIERGIFDTTSAKTLQNGVEVLRGEFDEWVEKQDKLKTIRGFIKKGYNDFLDNRVYKDNKGITKASINDLKPKFKKRLENRILNSFQLIKNKDEETKNALASRFLNYVTIDSKEVRGKGAGEKSFLDFMEFAKEMGIDENHALFILEDQTRKLTSELNQIVAKENGAIGCIWKTRRDKRVVGNPDGLYPEGNKAHNDHYERENKFFVYKDGWAYKQGLIKGEIYDNLEDGGVGVAIGCRCWVVNIYDLFDVPSENLTKKGAKFLEGA